MYTNILLIGCQTNFFGENSGQLFRPSRPIVTYGGSLEVTINTMAPATIAKLLSDTITFAVSLIIKAVIIAARFSGRVRKRSLKRLAAMDINEKDKEMLFLTDKLYQLHIAFIKSRLFYYPNMPVIIYFSQGQDYFSDYQSIPLQTESLHWDQNCEFSDCRRSFHNPDGIPCPFRDYHGSG